MIKNELHWQVYNNNFSVYHKITTGTEEVVFLPDATGTEEVIFVPDAIGTEEVVFVPNATGTVEVVFLPDATGTEEVVFGPVAVICDVGLTDCSVIVLLWGEGWVEFGIFFIVQRRVVLIIVAV